MPYSPVVYSIWILQPNDDFQPVVDFLFPFSNFLCALRLENFRPNTTIRAIRVLYPIPNWGFLITES